MPRTAPGLLLLSLSLCTVLPCTVHAESGAEIIDRMIAAEASNYADIDNLFQRTRTMGHSIPEYFERDGDYLRPVPISEVLEREQPNEMSQATAGDLDLAALELDSQSRIVDAAMQEEMAKSGLGGGQLGRIFSMAAAPEDPWLASNPGDMMRLYATFLRGAAESKREMAAERAGFQGDMDRNMEMIEALKSRTRIIGRNNIDGIDVIEVGADGLNLVQTTEGGTFTADSIRVFVDAERYVSVRFKLDGTLTQGKESRPMTIERTDSRFLPAAGCGSLLKPRHSVMRIGGALTPEQQAQLAEAQAQMAEFEKQLASMPPDQQKMVKQMMGSQFDQVKNMTKSGGIEVVTDIVELRCNQGPPTAEELAQKVF